MTDPVHASTDYSSKHYKSHITHFDKVAGPEFGSILEKIIHRTMLTKERLFDVYNSVKYISTNVPGDILEVGAWKGGCLGMMGLTLATTAAQKKRVFGIDTFAGHPRPSPIDIDIYGQPQVERFNQHASRNEPWAYADYSDTKAWLRGLFGSQVAFELIKGKVEEISSSSINVTDGLALIRIDVDWYSPTLHALKTFYPLLHVGGVLIIDDYGHYEGCKRAVQEFFRENMPKITFTDYSCITIQKIVK
ncbi:MAG: hypothetical protein EBV12_11555 [Betaproteobacteria bacterium]|nr:hypothetical protein [Betaproteobacteria bacterium]